MEGLKEEKIKNIKKMKEMKKADKKVIWGRLLKGLPLFGVKTTI